MISPEEFWEQFDEKVKKLLEGQEKNPKKVMRSVDVRKMLGISDSTLQSMRISRAIPASKVNGSWFYFYDEILEVLEKNKVKGGFNAES